MQCTFGHHVKDALCYFRILSGCGSCAQTSGKTGRSLSAMILPITKRREPSVSFSRLAREFYSARIKKDSSRSDWRSEIFTVHCIGCDKLPVPMQGISYLEAVA